MKCCGFVDAEKANHSIAMLCRVLQVARAGYYVAWDGVPVAVAATGPGQARGGVRDAPEAG